MLIKNEKDLLNFAYKIETEDKSLNAVLENNITVSGLWMPLPEPLKRYEAFSGVFDGAGHSITFNTQDHRLRALGFISINSGTIKNLTIRGRITHLGKFDDEVCIGGIAGCNLGSIINCKSYIDIEGNKAACGGITGKNTGDIISCENYGTINGSLSIAGIAAIHRTGKIINCNNYGQIGKNFNYRFGRTGGIVGINNSEVKDCANYGNIIYGRDNLDMPEIKNTNHRISQIIGKDWSPVPYAFMKSCSEKGRIIFMNDNTIFGQSLVEILTASDYDPEILKNDPHPEHQNSRGETYMHLACKSRYLREVNPELLIQVAADIATNTDLKFNELDNNGKTAFEYLSPETEKLLKNVIPEPERDDNSFSDIGFS